MAGAKLVGPEMMSQITTGYDKLGISMKSAGKAVGKLFKEAGEYGINFQLYSKNFANNLAMAQTYTFRNGVDGLKEMARKATEIRQDMQQVARFADKVGTVTGAVETAARLQVLGGSFTAMANPLAMLNESLTDMNGLQDRLTEMTKGAATYNSATHQIDIDPLTRMRIKAAAEAARAAMTAAARARVKTRGRRPKAKPRSRNPRARSRKKKQKTKLCSQERQKSRQTTVQSPSAAAGPASAVAAMRLKQKRQKQRVKITIFN
jgi:hypothetical protein